MKNVFINPFTKKELPTKPLNEIFGFKDTVKTEKNLSEPNQIDLLKEEVKTLTKQVSEMQDAFKAIAGADTKSIANIRAIAERLSDKLNCV